MDTHKGAAAMIDPTDKQTVALPLDEQPVKRKRGRPATGKAMTPAEKQKAYRERMKARQAQGVDPEAKEEIQFLKNVSERLGEKCDELTRQLREAKAKIEQLNNGNVAKKRRHRDDKPLERIAKIIEEELSSKHEKRYSRAIGRVEAVLEEWKS